MHRTGERCRVCRRTERAAHPATPRSQTPAVCHYRSNPPHIGHLRPIDGSYLSQILVLLLNQLSTRASGPQSVPDLALTLDEENEIPREITRQVMNWFGTIHDARWNPNVPLMVRQVGLGILSSYRARPKDFQKLHADPATDGCDRGGRLLSKMERGGWRIRCRACNTIESGGTTTGREIFRFDPSFRHRVTTSPTPRLEKRHCSHSHEMHFPLTLPCDSTTSF